MCSLSIIDTVLDRNKRVSRRGEILSFFAYTRTRAVVNESDIAGKPDIEETRQLQYNAAAYQFRIDVIKGE